MKKKSKKKSTIRFDMPDTSPQCSQLRVHSRMPNPAAKAPFLFIAGILVLICLAVYGNTLLNGFVYDDMTQVLNNSWIRDVRHLPDIFSKNVWGFQSGRNVSNYYRPMMHVIYLVSYGMFGLKPWGFHLVNIFFHMINSLLVFLVASSLFRPRRLQDTSSSPLPSFISPAFVAALLFALHPINTEAVAWVGAVTDLSYTFFYLCSLYFYIRAEDGFKNKEYFISLASFSLALLCKEPAVTLPAALIAYDITFGQGSKGIYFYAKKYSAFILLLGLYFIVRVQVLGGFAPVKMNRDLTTYQYCINVFPLISTYLEKLFIPIGQNAIHTFHPLTSLWDMKALLSLSITISFIAAVFIAYRKSRIIFFGLVVIIVPLLPALYTPAIGESPLAERYLYLPSVGFAIVLATLYSSQTERLQSYRLPIVAMALIAVLFSSLIIARNRIWRDNVTLYTDTIKKSPDAELPRGNFGIALLEDGRLDEAIEQFRVIITKINPSSENAYYNMGRAYMKKGAYPEAMAAFKKALSLDPNDGDAYRNLLLCYAKSGMIDQAVAEFATMMNLKPGAPDTLVLIGNELEKTGLRDEAQKQYKKAVEIDGNNFPARYSYANSLMNTGQVDEAIEQFRVTVKLQPDNPNCRNRLGVLYGQKGLYDKAIEQLEAAVQLAPGQASFQNNLNRARQLKMSGGKGKPDIESKKNTY